MVTLALGSHPLAEGLPEPWATEWGEDRFGPFMSFAVGRVVQRMRWVPSGRFLLGSSEDEVGRFNNEGPRHEITVSQGFWLADTPCIQALWQAVMGENPSRFVDTDKPVERVSWDDCQTFLMRLNERVPGFNARLPTEAEWEWACRGGTTEATWVGNLEASGKNKRLDAIAWYGGNTNETQRVGLKDPNPFGLYDMLGNVWEWCQDWYAPYHGKPDTDPRGPEEGSDRVMRGGAWNSSARGVRAAIRLAFHPGNRYLGVGFRLARGQAPGTRAEPGPLRGPETRAAGRGPGPA